MAEQGTDWLGRPMKSQGGRATDQDGDLLARLEGIDKPTAQDRGALAALRVRTPSGGSESMRVWALTEKWNAEFAKAKAAAEGKQQGDQEPRYLR